MPVLSHADLAINVIRTAKEPRQQRKAGRRYDLSLGCLLATVLQQFRSLFRERVHSGQREPFLLDDGLTKSHRPEFLQRHRIGASAHQAGALLAELRAHAK